MDGMTLVRGDLSRRIDALEADLAMRRAAGSSSAALAIASLAGEYGLVPVQRLAEGLSVALSSGGRGAAVGPWIERLRDAVNGEALDEQAANGWLASVVIRLAG